MSNSTDVLRRKQAYADFRNLELEGIKPTPNALFDWYVALNKRDPAQRARIPTLNRTTIYNWSREDEWKRKYAEEKIATSDATAEEYAELRNRAFGKLSLLQEEAIVALHSLLNSDDPKMVKEAAVEILDRTGLGKVVARPPASAAEVQARAANPKPTREGPPIGQGTDAIVAWLNQAGDKQINA